MLSEVKEKPRPFTFTKIAEKWFHLTTILLEHCPKIPAEIVLTECATKPESKLMF